MTMAVDSSLTLSPETRLGLARKIMALRVLRRMLHGAKVSGSDPHPDAAFVRYAGTLSLRVYDSMTGYPKLSMLKDREFRLCTNLPADIERFHLLDYAYAHKDEKDAEYHGVVHFRSAFTLYLKYPNETGHFVPQSLAFSISIYPANGFASNFDISGPQAHGHFIVQTSFLFGDGLDDFRSLYRHLVKNGHKSPSKEIE